MTLLQAWMTRQGANLLLQTLGAWFEAIMCSVQLTMTMYGLQGFMTCATHFSSTGVQDGRCKRHYQTMRYFFAT